MAFQRCDGFSGADLSALVIEASMIAFKELSRIPKSEVVAGPGSEPRVHLRHFMSAFNKVKPSVSGRDKNHYETMKRRQLVIKISSVHCRPYYSTFFQRTTITLDRICELTSPTFSNKLSVERQSFVFLCLIGWGYTRLLS